MYTPHKQLVPVILFAVITTIVVINSCRRIQHEELVPVNENSIESKFFNVPATVDPIIKALANKIYRQNEQYHFVNDLVKRVGFPVWDKSLIVTAQGARPANARVMDDSTTLVYIPFTIDSAQLVKATLLAQMSPDDSLFRLVYDREYKRFGFDSTSNYAWKAKNIFHLFATFQKSIYNHQSFQITDGRIFGQDSAWHPVASFQQNNSWQRLNTLQPVTVCDIIITCNTCLRPFKTSSTNAITEECCYPTAQNICTVRWINVDPGAGSLPPVFYTTDIGGGGTADPQTWWVNPCPNSGGGGVSKMSVTEECSSSSGWVPVPTTGGVLYPQLGFHHFETWDVSGEDYAKIQNWRQNNIDTIGIDSCLKKVLDKLLGGTNLIGRILTKMERSSSLHNNIEKFKIFFRVDSLPTGVSGRTLPGHYNTTTRIFTDTILIDDSLMMFGTELGVAHVVLHETIHAYLKSIFYRDFYHNYTATQIGRMNYDTIFNNYIDTLLSIHDRSQMNSWRSNNPEYDHNFMADKALERMVEALKAFDNNRLSDEYYWILSWSGLWKTITMVSHYPNYPSWPPTNPSPSNDSIRGLKYALTMARLDSIRTKVIDEIKGRPNAKGRPKIPGGCY